MSKESKLKTQLVKSDGSTDGKDRKEDIDGFAPKFETQGGRAERPADFDKPY